jgi:hypothetical protein
VSIVVPGVWTRRRQEEHETDPVATFDLPQGKPHGDGDETVRCQGAFVAYGGHGADQSTTIVFEVEPGDRLG